LPNPLSVNKNLAPLRSAIGLMEQWNSGIMGSGIMQCWIDGSASGGIDGNIKMAIILLKTNIPAFHHSIIPFSG